MPVVPFTQRPQELDDSLMPSDTHLMMAAATMRPMAGFGSLYKEAPPEPGLKEKLKEEQSKMEGRQRYQDLVNPEERLGKVETQKISEKESKKKEGPDLSY